MHAMFSLHAGTVDTGTYAERREAPGGALTSWQAVQGKKCEDVLPPAQVYIRIHKHQLEYVCEAIVRNHHPASW